MSLEIVLQELLQRAEGAIPHRALRAMAGLRLGKDVTVDDYNVAVESLVVRGQAIRSRGRGGSLRGVPQARPVQESPDEVGIEWSERRLQACLRSYLERQFYRDLGIEPSERWWVYDTSAGTLGEWRNPDFVAIRITPYKVLPVPDLVLYSFELKREDQGSVRAVAQTRDQTRMTHYGYLVWHLPERSEQLGRLPEVEAECRRSGVGLVRILDPNTVQTWRVLCDPERKAPPAAEVDDLLDELVRRDRMVTSQVEELRSLLAPWLRGAL
jgi:hypothetical protein